MKLRLVWLFLIALRATLTYGTHYYVSNRGLDVNSGRSTTQAWKTIGRVNGQKFAPGDRVLFQRGGIWRETLQPQSSGLNGNIILYGAYGSGERPILSGSDQIRKAQWRGIRNHIYLCGTKLPHAPPACVRKSGRLLQRVWNEVNLRRPGEWWFDFASGRIYLYSDSGPPDDLELQVRDSNIDNNEQSHITYQNLELKGARQGLRLYAWRKIVQDVTLQDSLIQTEETQDGGAMSAGVYANIKLGSFARLAIRNNEFAPFPTGLRNWGIYLVRGVNDFQIERNRFGPAGEDAITVWHSRNGVIRNNTGGGNGENTIDVKDSHEVLIEQNEAVDDNEYNIVVHSVDEAGLNVTSDIVVARNHCSRGGQGRALPAGIALLSVKRSKVIDNLIEDPMGEAVLVHDASSASGNEVTGNTLLQTKSSLNVVPVVLQNAAGTSARNNQTVTRTNTPRNPAGSLSK